MAVSLAVTPLPQSSAQIDPEKYPETKRTKNRSEIAIRKQNAAIRDPDDHFLPFSG